MAKHKNSGRIRSLEKAIEFYNQMVVALALSPHDWQCVRESASRLLADFNAQLETAKM